MDDFEAAEIHRQSSRVIVIEAQVFHQFQAFVQCGLFLTSSAGRSTVDVVGSLMATYSRIGSKIYVVEIITVLAMVTAIRDSRAPDSNLTKIPFLCVSFCCF